MSKQTNYSSVKNVSININFNRQSGAQFVPATIEVHCDAVTDEGGILGVNKSVTVGVVQDIPLTPKQMYTALNKAATGGLIAGVIKDAILDAINLDVTV